MMILMALWKPIQRQKKKDLIRLEGKEYVVQDGDIMLFRFNVVISSVRKEG